METLNKSRVWEALGLSQDLEAGVKGAMAASITITIPKLSFVGLSF